MAPKQQPKIKGSTTLSAATTILNRSNSQLEVSSSYNASPKFTALTTARDNLKVSVDTAMAKTDEELAGDHALKQEMHQRMKVAYEAEKEMEKQRKKLSKP